MHRDAFFLTPSDLLGRLLGMKWSPTRPATNWMPVLFGEIKQGKCVGVIGSKRGGIESSLVTFHELDSGTVLPVQIFAVEGVQHRRIRVLARAQLHSLADRGLDGAVVRRYQVRLLTDENFEENLPMLAAAE
jgi:hypothetical protein